MLTEGGAGRERILSPPGPTPPLRKTDIRDLTERIVRPRRVVLLTSPQVPVEKTIHPPTHG